MSARARGTPLQPSIFAIFTCTLILIDCRTKCKKNLRAETRDLLQNREVPGLKPGTLHSLVALAVDGLFALQIEGIVSVGHQALLVGLHGLGEDLEVSLSEAAVTQGTQRQDALQQSVHLGDGVLDLAAQAKATEKQVVDGIRAKGARPQENGTTSQGAFIVKDDVSKLSKRDRAEIIRRAARGEHIEF